MLRLATLFTLLPFAAMAEGMPQMDFANPLTKSQVVWGVIIFLVLYLLLSKWALPGVGAVLESRAARIAADLETAMQAKNGAEAARHELALSAAAAHATAQGEIAAAIAAAKAANDAQSASLNARLDARLAEAEQQIATARASALGALRQVAGEAAGEVVTRLTGRAPDAQSVDRAVAATMAASGRTA
jgi:F-type H+-transporting ATPase subunit b